MRKGDEDDGVVFVDAETSATGIGCQASIFKRVGLKRTPPRQRAGSLGDLKAGLVTSLKRKASSPPQTARRREENRLEYLKLVLKVTKHGNDMENILLDMGSFIKANRNVHVQMKSYTSALRAAFDRLQHILAAQHDCTKELMEEESPLNRSCSDPSVASISCLKLGRVDTIATQTEDGTHSAPIGVSSDVQDTARVAAPAMESPQVRPLTRNMATQTMDEGSWGEQTRAGEIRAQLAEAGGQLQVALRLVEEEWPDQAFHNTSWAKAGREGAINPTALRTSDVVQFMSGSDEDIRASGAEHYEDLMLNDLGPGEVVFCKVTTEKSLKGVATKQECFKYFAALEKPGAAGPKGEKMEVLAKATKSVIDLASSHGRTNLIVVAPRQKAQLLRKLLEIYLEGSEITVAVADPANNPARIRRTYAQASGNAPKPPEQRRPANPYANDGREVVVQAGGLPYADLLKKIKAGVGQNELNKKISNVRRTAKGDLCITVEKGIDGAGRTTAEALREVIVSQTGSKALIRANNVVLHIKNLEGSVTLEELRAELAVRAKTEVGGIMVTSFRPAFGGRQAASVVVEAGVGATLVALGKVRLGWTDCIIKERVPDQQQDTCFRCWEKGHHRAACSGLDRSKCCLRCGEAGHFARQCQAPPSCPLCKASGHSARTDACPRSGRRRREENPEAREGNFQTASERANSTDPIDRIGRIQPLFSTNTTNEKTPAIGQLGSAVAGDGGI